MRSDRRRSERFPVGFFFHQVIDDELHRSFTTDLSTVGLYAERPMVSFTRNSNIVQIELPLPDTSDSIWAKAEVVYDRFGAIFHGTGIRFLAMARPHQRLLRDWLRDGPGQIGCPENPDPEYQSGVLIIRPKVRENVH